MRRLPVPTLALPWLAVAVAYMQTTAQAAGQRGCCTDFSEVRAEILSKAGGTVRCRWQGITEGCNINAVVLKLKRHQICVNPRPRKMRALLNMLCSSSTAAGRTARKPGQRKRRRTKS